MVPVNQVISFITLDAADLACSRAFYPALADGHRQPAGAIAFVQSGAVVFALFPIEVLAVDALVSSAESGFAGFRWPMTAPRGGRGRCAIVISAVAAACLAVQSRQSI